MKYKVLHRALSNINGKTIPEDGILDSAEAGWSEGEIKHLLRSGTIAPLDRDKTAADPKNPPFDTQ